MTWNYAYNLDLWPAIIAIVLTIILCLYSWKRRSVPGARAFAIGCVFAILWVIGSMMEIAATDLPTKVIWLKFHALWQLPSVIAISCFIVQYAGLGRYLTRRNLILLAIPAVVTFVLIATDSFHHLYWTEFALAEQFTQKLGVGSWLSILYANLLGLMNLAVLIWLAVGSPRYRKPVAFIMLGQFAGRALYLVDSFSRQLFSPGESVFLVIGVTSALYAFALFYYQVLDPVPLARAAVIEHMGDGMFVLDLQGHVVDLNPKALQLLGVSAASVCGRAVVELLPASLDFAGDPGQSALAGSEIQLGVGSDARFYNLSLTRLMDRRGDALGFMLLLRDVTGQKRAQELMLEKQRTAATLLERERLARELHDSIGQVLSFVSLQAQTACKWSAEGNVEKAEPLLQRLAEVAQEAHADVRESILSLRTGAAPDWTFLRALRQYLEHFRSSFNIRTELSLPEGFDESGINPVDGVQVMRVIQEALSNARKHSGASLIRVRFEQDGQLTHVEVKDDGHGFDLADEGDGGQHFGLQFMRERMAMIGGSVDIESQPGAGTLVRLSVPAGR